MTHYELLQRLAKTILYCTDIFGTVLCCINWLFVDRLGLLKTRSVLWGAILSGHQAQHKAHHGAHHQAQHKANCQARHHTHNPNVTLCNALNFVQCCFIHWMPMAGSRAYNQDNVMLCDNEK